MSNHETANEHLITAAPPSTTSTNLRNSFTTFPRDVRIEVYLKPNQTYPFDFVDSITHRDNNLVIKTCIGLEMLVESGYTVSDISGLFDTTNITAANGDNTDALAATIVVPPGYAFRVVDVVDVCEMEGETARTRIETVRATLLVRTGDYVVVRRNCRDSVTVETTEC